MEKEFKVSILTATETVFDGQIVSMIAPGELGYLGVLANHAPLVSTLIKGKINLRDASGKTVVFYSKGKGFLEVRDNKATLLLESA